jgi:L-threonylcarbamoyladenylate synthase
MPQVSLSELVAAARSGSAVISFPTDTVPALAVRPERSDLIYALKQRSQEKPLILMGADADALWPYVAGSKAAFPIWRQIARQHWPGPLTLVLPTSEQAPLAMNPLTPGTLGIRVPNHPLARHILSLTGPLATTSANRSGQPALEDPVAIAEQFPAVAMLSNQALAQLPPGALAGPTGSGVPSTVARWTGLGWEILRQGAIQL